eukprot:1118204-Pelagomonas_calceolata.AAC.6
MVEGGQHKTARIICRHASCFNCLSFPLLCSRRRKEKRKLHRQRSFPLHQLRKGDALAQKIHEFPLPQGYRVSVISANGDLEGCWKHPAPRPGCAKGYKGLAYSPKIWLIGC